MIHDIIHKFVKFIETLYRVEEVKVTKARSLITLQDAKDPCVRKANIKVDGGRKANTKREVDEARSRLRMRDIAGIANKGREGV